MTQPVSAVDYFSASAGTCPLCNKRPTINKSIYGYPVCKKCFYAFANRRQGAFLLDELILLVPYYLVAYFVVPTVGLFARPVSPVSNILLLQSIFAAGFAVVFSFKDGINGRSPAKYLLNLETVDNLTGAPITMLQSFKRWWFMYLGIIPILGWLTRAVIVLICAFQVSKGYRIGDRFAGSRVIWKRYAHLPMFSAPNEARFEVVTPAIPTATAV